MQAYDFLDKHQEEEVKALQKAVRKTKSIMRKESLRGDLVK